MSIGRLDQKCRLLQRQKNVLCIYEYYVWALNYYSSWTGIIIGTVMHHLSQNSDFARNCSHCHAGSQKLFPIAQLIVWCQIWLYRLTIVCRFKEILLILTLTMIHGVAHHSDYAFDTLILVLCRNRKGRRENLNRLHEARWRFWQSKKIKQVHRKEDYLVVWGPFYHEYPIIIHSFCPLYLSCA